MASNDSLTDAQKQYLQGFVAGTEALRTAQGLGRLFPTGSGTVAPAATVSGPEAVHHEARARTVAAGKTLVAEEQTKRDKHPFDMWDEMRANADAGLFPKGPDIFRYKFHGLFYV